MRHLVLLLFLFYSFASYAQRIFVLSVGICDYKNIRNLKNAETDARNIADLYNTHTKNITMLLGSQATHDNILSNLHSCFSQATKEDIVVFFFSGHGSKGGLCAYDTSSKRQLVTYREIQNAMRSCNAGTKQLFIDACFSGGLREKSKSGKNMSDTTPLPTDIDGIMLFLSSRTGETSQENPWSDNGFFTQYLIKGMKGAADINKDRIITAKEIFSYVSKNVSERTHSKQNPVMWGKFNDNMHIFNWNHKK